MLALAGNIVPVRAQLTNKPSLEYQVKAAFLFNFTRFVEWPPSAYSSASAPFVIGIAGDDPFGSYLDDLVNGEEVDGHRIVVRRYPDGGNMDDCQMLFISSGESFKVKEILASATRQGLLTVGDGPNFISWGGAVRFFEAGNHVKIEIKLAAAKAGLLEISAKLLQVAKIK